MRISIFSLAIVYNVLSFDTKQKENHVKKVTIFVVSKKASVDTRYFFNKHDKFSYGNNVLFIPIYIVKMTALLRLPKEVGDLFMSFAFLLVLLVKLNCVVGNLCSGYGQAQRCGGLILAFFFLGLGFWFQLYCN
jgi:hypothetical protein